MVAPRQRGPIVTPHRFGRRFRHPAVPLEPEELIRAELFSIERLEQHGESLAREQSVIAGRGGRSLVRRLHDNDRVLRCAHGTIAAAIREERAITPAAEWLVDNFHVVEEQIREIRDGLPDGYYRQLPKLASGHLEGCPRVYGLAWAFVAHTDSLLDLHALERFVRAYQRVQPLTIGELWAVAITLRIVLVENLRRAALGIVSRRTARQDADAFADRILGGTATTEMQSTVASRLPTAFAVQLVHRLRHHDPVVTPALRWLAECLALQGTTIDAIVHEEHGRQGSTNVTVRNVVTSMRLMSMIDWAEFFEGQSLVDRVLDASGGFKAMDFPTRDRYRHAVEDLARGSRHSEIEVARRAVAAAARDAPPHHAGPVWDAAARRRRQDPGYHLVAGGRRSFEIEIGFRVPMRNWLPRAQRATGILGYLTTVAILGASCLAVLWLGLAAVGVGGSATWLVLLLAIVPASDLAIALVNRRVTKHFGPVAMPGLELRGGVPADLRTMVAVPTMLSSIAAIDEQVERLEVHHLASPDDDLCFALLSDWGDSACAHAPDDDEMLAAAQAGIARLNRRHGPAPCGPRFLLLHRRRVWNAGEGKWIGWERKRGKLHELNRWLRGAKDTTFLQAPGSPAVPEGVRFVLTLDADTRLPCGAARRLVGKLAHPLNRPSFDIASGRVVEGHAVLQPRITPMLPNPGGGSPFQRACSGASGLDPYACAVSDVYQDLLGEGSYSGKGIYEIDAFEAAQAGRVPDNTVLSHDLLEGIFARAGLVTDVELVEDFPTRYDVAAARQHRWARGDWQLLPWVLGRGRGGTDRARSAIPVLGRWKLLDNLRRTLVAPAGFLLLAVAGTFDSLAAAITAAFVLTTIAVPSLLSVFASVVSRRSGVSIRSHVRAVRADAALATLQIFLAVALLAHQALLMGDATVRTVFRLCVGRRHMLEWLTAAQAQFRLPLSVRGFCRRMAGSLVLVALVGIIVFAVGGSARPVALPLFALWLTAPLVARWASRCALGVATSPIEAKNVRTLRTIARRTWSFFEEFVGAGDNMLPPDNFQEVPLPVVAHRTSPTNIGLYLLSVASARDFGWIGVLETVARLEATLDTVQRLEHHRGHLYNWYDTRTLRPLEPKYVSTVDSGNFAGHLIALGKACREMQDESVANPARLAGIGDTLELTRACLHTLADDRRTQLVSRAGLTAALEAFEAVRVLTPTSPHGAAAQLADLAAHAETVVDIAATLADERGDRGSADVLAWASALRAAVQSHARDFDELLPWARLGAQSIGVAVGDGDAGFAASLASIPTLRAMPDRCEAALRILAERRATAEGIVDVDALVLALERSGSAARALERRLTSLAERIAECVQATEFGFLLDKRRLLLSIGFQVVEDRLDPSCYDLLASEARLASFVAIAKGDVPVKHWFRLGRGFCAVEGGAVLLSWSGSLFEYLMPGLVVREPAGSLLDQTCRFVVRQQIWHGLDRDVPWGVSESAYNARNVELTYQYSSFGVPGLGQKRGLGADTVVAPYATALAAMVDPRAAIANFARLTEAGAAGRYGFYEALDYTAVRRPPGADVAIVRAFMSHHQGMTLVAIGNVLHRGRMRARFHAEPMVQAAELLLQERIPRGVAMAERYADDVAEEPRGTNEIAAPTVRRFHTPHDPVPRTHLLSNGRYAVMLTAAGAGYSRWHDLAVTRWREDVTRDPWGNHVFLRDTRTADVWSAGYQPTGREPDTYEVAFSEGRAEIVRRDGSLQTTLEAVVSPENDAEVRRVSITNFGSHAREIDVTSYAEIVLATPAADAAHPAFAKLFVQTEYIASLGALVATRRVRAPADVGVWAAHLTVVEGLVLGDVQWETDRARFLGRGNTACAPIAIVDGRSLSGTVGTVLDAVFSMRQRVRILPGETARVAFWTMVAASRAAVLDLADKHRDPTAFERASTLAWTQAQVQLHHGGIDHDEAHLFQRLANRVIYSDPTLRPPSEVLQRNEQGPQSVWAHGISGDLPIVIVRISETEDLEIVRQLLRAHQYWRLKRLAVDLVVVNERTNSYTHDLQEALETLVRASQQRPQFAADEARGRVFVLRADVLSVATRTALQSVARVVLSGRSGSLSEQVRRPRDWSMPRLSAPPTPGVVRSRNGHRSAAAPDAEFWNGLGGFTDRGREYTTILGEGQYTPAPWINVIANPDFGFQVSVEGSGYVWAGNSRENQLTPWSNDPTSDEPGEVLYVRDLDSDAVWCPTASPIRTAGSYVARHGQGYSRFFHQAHDIELDLLQFVPLADSVKISRLRLRNRSARFRRLSVTAYVEWVLGPSRAATAAHVVTTHDPATGIVFARNPWRQESGSRVAFADLGGRLTAWTCDRTEFLGRNGRLDAPRALLTGSPLAKRSGAGLDPCGVLQGEISLESDGETEVVFLLGEAATREDAIALVAAYRGADLDRVLRSVTDHWDALLDVVQVETPDRSMDLLLNRWLLYQTVVCRLWARAAFYQAGGAYGFRDQLQDGMALVLSRPAMTREHLLRAAARQFTAGDVQHWWLPHSGRGVRTRISDDCLWLAHAAAHYVDATGDVAVLGAVVPFLDGDPLLAGEHESCFQPAVSDESGTLYEHCARALDRSLSVGAHGLPLIGAGDWNDGMNRVGVDGRGESVWLAWFLHGNLMTCAPWAEARGESARASAWREHAARLLLAIEQHGWDGEWYQRGCFDDGTPLGAGSNVECRIDSIAQSWAVFSGAGDPVRAKQAMASVVDHLVARAAGLVLLFAPPFDRGRSDPGYVKGYPPGVRENGGQYTHAATWCVIALAMLGSGDLASELFAMLNPIARTRTRAAVHRYRVEPYVVCADVYGVPPHEGRGGWTWYTGSSAWLYRAALEWMLGFRVRAELLHLDPCVPAAWPRFTIMLRHRTARYRVVVENPLRKQRGVVGLHLDGVALPVSPATVPLVDDGESHAVRVVMG